MKGYKARLTKYFFVSETRVIQTAKQFFIDSFLANIFETSFCIIELFPLQAYRNEA